MTKPSYRMLKWTFLAAMAASLGTACVVSSGDGTDTDIDDGGSSGSTSSAAGKGGGGSGGKGGTTSGGTSGTGGSGGTADGGEPVGGSPPTYTAGLCEEELGTMTPSSLPSCTPTDKDEQDACLKCAKANCCEEWQLCYGSNPTSACGYGATSDEDLGQFDCIQRCFTSTYDGILDEAEVLGDCEAMCLNQCASKDDFATSDTQALLGCTHDKCIDECYPPKE